MITAETFECFPLNGGTKSMVICELPIQSLSWLDYLGPIATASAALAAIVTLMALFTDSRRRSRPYIEAKLEVGFWGDGSADLIIENFGTTPARDITVTCDELEAATTNTAKELKRYFSKHRILRPGERIRLIWNNQPEGSVMESGLLVDPRTDIPELTTLKVAYRRQNLKGNPAKLFTPYREVFHLDASFKSVVPVTVGLPDRDNGDMTENHKDLRKGIELIARQIGELRR